jgi:hypothetical protein
MASIELAIAKQNASKLVSEKLWDDTGDQWHVPDYLDYNPSREEVLHKKAVRAEAGRLGGLAKASKKLANAKQNAKQNDSKIVPPSPSPDDEEDSERQQALTDLQSLGLFNASMLAQFNDMWPELSGRRDWIGKAITIARDSSARSPLPYALKILANSLHTGKEPGYTPTKYDPDSGRRGVPAPPKDEQDAADARQAAYEQEIANQLARAGRLL